ncbi:carboxypeptidase B-like [Leguminivora glycinivorella]|uniref:carboxypeptidase B-like n=1 Tax=Leguminivora glycinivorella TaxID=1035111 RepID=UPI00200D4182|nr:carboxypeptidase B-like [Leguminivora glycinivorella]
MVLSFFSHQIFKVTIKNQNHVLLLKDLEEAFGLDVWSEATVDHPGTVMVSRARSQMFQDLMADEGILAELEVENVKDLLDLEDKLIINAASKNRTSTRASASGLPLNNVYRYDEINAYLEELARAYPNIVTLVNAGKSFEGRDIKYIKISTTNFQDTSKPIVYMESLLHAREWITQSATLYAIQKLVIDVTEQDLLQDIDWIILPIANPDGFEFTHTDQRLWRKNRAVGYMVGDLCAGVDLNRNFDAFWSTASSNVVCMDTFHGRAPFSEPETAIIRNIIDEHKDRLELLLDIHSFGSMILYGYGNGVLPANGLNVGSASGVRMAQEIDAVKMSWNSNYIVGNVALVLYQASGSAMDYAKVAGVPLAYTFELPGHRYGLGTGAGFFVDPDFIEQAGFETWEGIKTGARSALAIYRTKFGAK